MARILIVDDDPAILEILGAYLRQEGHTVLEAADGDTGREGLAGADLAILDWMLPGVSGLNHASRSDALLPNVVNDGSSLLGLTSHGLREPRLRIVPVGSVQPSTGSWSSEVTQQPMTSFFGVWSGENFGVGLVGKYCHLGGNGMPAPSGAPACEERLTLPT